MKSTGRSLDTGSPPHVVPMSMGAMPHAGSPAARQYSSRAGSSFMAKLRMSAWAATRASGQRTLT